MNAGDKKEPVDLTQLFMGFVEKYKNVFFMQFENEVFIYRSLGRAAYKEIMTENRLTDYEKEEVICQECLLYPDPETFDWDNCDAGFPTELRKNILKNSYLDNLYVRLQLRQKYRQDMYELDNQISCVINEAFPNIDIEEIETWDVDKATRYLAKAEWKLKNLRGVEFYDNENEMEEAARLGTQDPFAHTNDPLLERARLKKIAEGDIDAVEVPVEQAVRAPEKAPIEPAKYVETSSEDELKTIRGGNKKDKLTPDKIRERNEFFKKFPEFANDDVLRNGMKGLEQPTVDTTPPALRTGF